MCNNSEALLATYIWTLDKCIADLYNKYECGSVVISSKEGGESRTQIMINDWTCFPYVLLKKNLKEYMILFYNISKGSYFNQLYVLGDRVSPGFKRT